MTALSRAGSAGAAAAALADVVAAPAAGGAAGLVPAQPGARTSNASNASMNGARRHVAGAALRFVLGTEKDGGGGGNRTRVRTSFPRQSYRRVRPFRSRAPPLRPTGSVTRQLDWISSAAHERGHWTSLRLYDVRSGSHRRGPGKRRLVGLPPHERPLHGW